MKYLLLLVLFTVGCSKPSPGPDVMTGTHKVWTNQNFLEYENDRGFGCGDITRSDNGYIYTARVINWHGEVDAQDPTTMWNSFSDAEAFVEKWCKP